MYVKLQQYDRAPSADDADEHTEEEFVIGVLAENHAGCADASAEEHAERQPVSGVKVEHRDGEGEEHADDATRGCRMGRNLNPIVDDGTDDLNQQGGCYDGRGEMRHMERFHQEEQGRVADDADDIRHIPAFPAAQLVACPTVELPVGKDDHAGKENGEQIHNADHRQLIGKGKSVKVTERQQHDEGHRRQIERCKQYRDDLR